MNGKKAKKLRKTLTEWYEKDEQVREEERKEKRFFNYRLRKMKEAYHEGYFR